MHARTPQLPGETPPSGFLPRVHYYVYKRAMATELERELERSSPRRGQFEDVGEEEESEGGGEKAGNSEESSSSEEEEEEEEEEEVG